MTSVERMRKVEMFKSLSYEALKWFKETNLEQIEECKETLELIEQELDRREGEQ